MPSYEAQSSDTKYIANYYSINIGQLGTTTEWWLNNKILINFYWDTSVLTLIKSLGRFHLIDRLVLCLTYKKS